MKSDLYDMFRIYGGLNILSRSDAYLLKHNLSERSITHKLAEHYQQLFYEWDVDCEYNRNLDKNKKIEIHPEEILRQMANKLESLGYSIDVDKEDRYIREQLRNLEKQLRDPKRLEIDEILGVAWFILNLDEKTTVKKAVFPDIIIHHRGTTENNIVIEAKKSINKNIKDRSYDLVKLMTLVSSVDLNYKYGFFIDIPVESDFERLKEFLPPQEFNERVYKILPEYL